MSIKTWQCRVKEGTWEGDAMKLEIADLRLALAALKKGYTSLEDDYSDQMLRAIAAEAELAALKGQEPVMQHCPNCNHEQTALSVDCGNCGNVYDAAPIQAGAQPAQQEPETSPEQHYMNGFAEGVKRTKAQEQRKPLTDEQIELCMNNAYSTVKGRQLEHAFARAIEQAHGIKEQG